MNKVPKYEIAFAGLSIGEHRFEFEFDSTLFQSFDGSGIESGQGRIDLIVNRHASMIEVQASVTGELQIQCDRCADLYTQPIDFTGSVIVKLSEEQGEYDGDIIWLDPRASTLDLTQWIYESIILALPLQRVHSDRAQCNAETMKYITISEE